MAERERKSVYRSVSFKKFSSWSADRQHRPEDLAADRQHRPEDLAADRHHRPEDLAADRQHKSEDLCAAGVALPPEQSSATRNVSVSRKVSKISATATTAGLQTADPKRASSAISPSIRQLTEKFNSSSSRSSSNSRGSSGVSPGDGAAFTRGTSAHPRAKSSRRPGSFHEESSGGYFQDSDNPTAESLSGNPAGKLQSDTDSGSDSRQKWIFTRGSSDCSSGKREYSHIINACSSEPRKCVTTDEETDVTVRGVPPPCKSHRSYISTNHSDFIPHSDKWPSVTKIRQLFDDKQVTTKSDSEENLKSTGRHLHELSPSESDRSEHLPPNEASSVSLPGRSIIRAQSKERESATTTAAKETFCPGMDFNSKTDINRNHSNDEELDSETPNKNKVSSFLSGGSSSTGGSHYRRINSSPYRSHSPSTEPEAAQRTLRTTGLTSDPSRDLQPPATPSWSRSESRDTSSSSSCCSSSLRQPTGRERRDRQGVGLPRDSLHSSHSSSRAPAPTSSSSSSVAPAPDKAITSSSSSTVAPSNKFRAPERVEVSPLSSHWRFSSGDEEEELTRRRRAGGWCVPSIPNRAGERGAPDRGVGYLPRSKNGWWGAKGIGRSSGSEEDSPGSLGPHGRDAVRRRSLRKKKKVGGSALASGRDDYDHHDGESEDSDSDALTMEQSERQQNAGGEFTASVSRSHSVREPSNRARVQQWERIASPVASTTLPGVSRVSKVNIPPFLSSPGGSRCSSRYSSTETLKEEDQNRAGLLHAGGNRPASSSMLSKTYHGNFTMYRSPSFGHGDNFSRNAVRVRPKILPTVTPSSTALAREAVASAAVKDGETAPLTRPTGGGGVDYNDKNQISMSNPDIASETMSLLSFLKSDLSELKVRKTCGEKSGLADGTAVYRMGSRNQNPVRRPSLKDLTATLRRAKSFTYSDKPSAAATGRLYLTGNATKRSSSEQQLDLDGEEEGGRVPVPEREVESDGGDFRVGRMKDYGYDDDDDEERMPTPLQERYVQEARQVIRDICQMSSREDDDHVVVRGTDDEDDLEDEVFQVKKTSETEKAGVSSQEQAATDQEAELQESGDGDKHESERENRERSERDGQSMHLEKLSRGTEYREKARRQSRETEGALLKGDSEESMYYDRSVDELSGHESSLTDEGIVTEPEMGPADPSERSFLGSAGVNLGSRIAKDVLGQPVTVWKQSALHKAERDETTAENNVNCANRVNEVCTVTPSLPHAARLAESDTIIMDVSSAGGSEEINTNIAGSQRSAGGGLEAPATPSSIRRRRKFSPSGNNAGSDSSNGSNNADSTNAAVGNGESTVYRSLSDPMPQRHCAVAEEGNKTFSSVDSNLLGSLVVKGGGGPDAVVELSEYKGSVASDLSVYSDGGLRDDSVIRDYSGVIRSIVAEPGAMDRLMTDDHGNGKAPKKKSFSDPSRRGDAPSLSQNDGSVKSHAGGNQPISELDQPGQIPPSSSEPILSEQREELWEAEVKPKHALPSIQIVKAGSQPECSPNSDNHEDEDDDAIDRGEEETEVQKFNFRLAEVLSPRMVRRPARKRPNRLAQFFPYEDPFEPSEPASEDQEEPNDQTDQTDLTPPLPSLLSRPKMRPKHVRHASEPATFIPISPPPQRQVDCPAFRVTAEPQNSTKPPGDEAPSLEDVTQKYILELSAAEGPGAPPGARDVSEGLALTSETPGDSGITDAGSQKKSSEDSTSTAPPQRTKPRVVSPHLFI